MYRMRELSFLVGAMMSVTLLGPATILHAGRSAPPTAAEPVGPSDLSSSVAADPEATRLLAEARAARLTWTNFPGFRAQVTVNMNGAKSTGSVVVAPTGQVEVSGLPEAAQKWVRRTLGSAVSHRLAAPSAEDTPCVFADSDTQHPLGRLVRVLNDELHSHYRIKDRQITLVQRDQAGSRFTITVLANQWNDSGKYLPSAFLVHWWDGQTGALIRSEGHTQTWQRVGTFDLPREIRVVSANQSLQTYQLQLDQIQLAPGSAGAEGPAPRLSDR